MPANAAFYADLKNFVVDKSVRNKYYCYRCFESANQSRKTHKMLGSCA